MIQTGVAMLRKIPSNLSQISVYLMQLQPHLGKCKHSIPHWWVVGGGAGSGHIIKRARILEMDEAAIKVENGDDVLHILTNSKQV